MPEPEATTVGADPSTAKLLAIVAVEKTDRVRCGQPGCGHSVYRRIHVVREGGKLLVLGSTCFAKRYGSYIALGGARFGGGEGRRLTEEERQLLINNTDALLARFEAEKEAERQRLEAIAQAIRKQAEAVEAARKQAEKAAPPPAYLPPRAISATPQARRTGPPQETPWGWVKPLTSIIYLKLHDGSGWIRAQRRDDRHVLVPWPVFDGWDEALPPLFGQVDVECGGYALPDVVAALRYLRDHANWETKPGRWKDVMTEIASRTPGGARPGWL